MRSALFVPGDRPDRYAKAIASGADAILIDLEDSVALAAKAQARWTVGEWLGSDARPQDGPAIFVRLNAFDTETLEDDLAAIMPGAPDGVMLPKAEHGHDVTRLDALLRVAEAEAGLGDGATAIIAIVTETAVGVLNAGTYRRSSKRLAAMTWGAEDLSADIGALRRRNEVGSYADVFRLARAQTIIGAVAAGVQPLDTVYPDIRDLDGFRRECEEAVADGFTGKMAIHPAQVPVINEVFTPSSEAVAEAERIVAAFAEAGDPGVLQLDGEMLDRPHLRKAQALLKRTGR